MDAERLLLSTEEMRRFGYRAVDMLIAHVEGQADSPIGRKAGRAELEALLREPVPEQPGDPFALLDRAEREIFANMLHVDHPRFFAFVPGPGNFVSAIADALAAGMNVFAGTWFAGSAPAQVELVVTDWLRDFCGLPASAGGLLVSGGSLANLTALAVARHHLLGEEIGTAMIYASDQTHSSVARSLSVLGFRSDQIVILPSDAELRLPIAALRERVAADRAAGRRPFCVVANAGTTNSGAVDPLAALAILCREEGLWLHADGAYGAPAMLTDRGRALLDGLGQVDSLSLDPHKWLFQSFETGCVLVRDRALLLETFQVMPEYLRDTESGLEEVNFANHGIQLTRGFRALKIWLSLQVFGLDAFRKAIARGIFLAELAEQALRRSGAWRIVTPAQLAIVTFRYDPPDLGEAEVDRLHARLVEAMMADGHALATSTLIGGRPVLRLCTINPRTEDTDIEETVRRLTEMAAALAGGG